MVRTASALYLVLALAASAFAQPRPDAGTLQERTRVIPSLPPAGGPAMVVPANPAHNAETSGEAPRITPAGFRIEGNTLFPSETLVALLASRVGRPTDLAGLNEAARAVREYYQDRGYLLTDALVPEQTLPREGGIVTLQVIEARIGEVTVKLDTAASSRAAAVVLRALPKGAIASEYLLDQPVLLVRDMPGHDAVATVQPGATTGEVDVVVTVRATPRAIDVSMGLDNHGVSAAGKVRGFASVEIANVSGNADALSARLQVAEITATRLYRIAYVAPPLGDGTRATGSLARSEYALGGTFAALGASGTADVAAVSVLQPIERARLKSTWTLASLEHKTLNDRVAAGGVSDRRIDLARVGIAGNSVDEALGSGAYNSYAASYAYGRLQLDAATAAADAGGLRTAGGFGKANLELQRTQFFASRWSLVGSLQAQWAFANLASAEKMSVGGPTGVRAYPAGEAPGDSAALLSLELRYQFATAPWPVSGGLFYDAARVRASYRPILSAGNQRSISGAGVSLLAGTIGRFVTSASLAWRTGGERPTGGEPDRSPRFWVATQAWF